MDEAMECGACSGAHHPALAGERHSLSGDQCSGAGGHDVGAFALIDEKRRAHLQVELAPCSTQAFMDAYAAAHHASGLS